MTYPWLALEARRDPGRQWLTWAVRMKLDLCGIRIGLAHWQALSGNDRETLHELPVGNGADMQAFRRTLESSLARAGQEMPAIYDERTASARRELLSATIPPASVTKLLARWRIAIEWTRLDTFGRYILCAIAGKRDPDSFRADLVALIDSPTFDQLLAPMSGSSVGPCRHRPDKPGQPGYPTRPDTAG